MHDELVGMLGICVEEPSLVHGRGDVDLLVSPADHVGDVGCGADAVVSGLVAAVPERLERAQGEQVRSEHTSQPDELAMRAERGPSHQNNLACAVRRGRVRRGNRGGWMSGRGVCAVRSVTRQVVPRSRTTSIS